MDNTITIAEIKRQGMAAITARLRLGPAHIVKRNKRTAVILSEEAYQDLLNQVSAPLPGKSALDWLAAHSGGGERSREEIDAALRVERSW